jgi:hypothetical protein
MKAIIIIITFFLFLSTKILLPLGSPHNWESGFEQAG